MPDTAPGGLPAAGAVIRRRRADLGPSATGLAQRGRTPPLVAQRIISEPLRKQRVLPTFRELLRRISKVFERMFMLKLVHGLSRVFRDIH